MIPLALLWLCFLIVPSKKKTKPNPAHATSLVCPLCPTYCGQRPLGANTFWFCWRTGVASTANLFHVLFHVALPCPKRFSSGRKVLPTASPRKAMSVISLKRKWSLFNFSYFFLIQFFLPYSHLILTQASTWQIRTLTFALSLLLFTIN